MTTADRKLIDEAIQNQDFFDWWNKASTIDGENKATINRESIIDELLEMLEESGLDLKVVRKK